MSMAEKEAREYQTDQMNQGGLAPRGRVGGGRKKLSRVSLQALRGNEMKTKRKTKKIDAPRAWGNDISGQLKHTAMSKKDYAWGYTVPVRIIKEADYRRLVRGK